jgi:hypothetical protein
MAATVSRVTGVKDTVVGNQRMVVRSVTFDSSYVTGGEPVSASQFGLKQINAVVVAGAVRKNDATSALIASYDHVNQTLVAYWSAGSGAAPLQVTNATDLSAYSVRLIVFGYGTG